MVLKLEIIFKYVYTTIKCLISSAVDTLLSLDLMNFIQANRKFQQIQTNIMFSKSYYRHATGSKIYEWTS